MNKPENKTEIKSPTDAELEDAEKKGLLWSLTDEATDIRRAYIALRFGNPNHRVRLRFIHDSERNNPMYPVHEDTYTLDNLTTDIVRHQIDGYGVFFFTNDVKPGFSGKFATDADMGNTCGSLYIDADTGLPTKWHREPPIIVHTSMVKGVQKGRGEWPLNPCIMTASFKPAMLRLAISFNSDKAVTNPSRVLRLPGTLHLKDPNNPQKVTFIDNTHGEPRVMFAVSPAEVLEGIPELPEQEVSHKTASGVPISEQTLRDMLSYLDPNAGRDEWLPIIAAIRASPIDGDEETRRQIAIEFSRGNLDRQKRGTPSRFTSEADVSKVFDTMPPKEGGAGIGTLIDAAHKAGWQGNPFATSAPSETFAAYKGDDIVPDAKPKVEVFYPAPLTGEELETGTFPEPEYLIEGGIVMKQHANLLYGDGGVGKTVFALNEAVAIAAGKPFMGYKTQQAPVLLVLAEDGEGATKKRLLDICASYTVKLSNIPLLTWCLPSHDIALCSVSDEGEIKYRTFYDRLCEQLDKRPGTFVVLDAMADMALMNENIRQTVNAFLKRAVGGLCPKFGATPMVLGHPSKSSMNDGTMYSGSTAFNNSVRSRATLERLKDADLTDQRRKFTVAKPQYGVPLSLDVYMMGGSMFLSSKDQHVQTIGRDKHEIIMGVVFKMIDRGVSLVRGQGNGQKPRGIVAAITDAHGTKHGITVNDVKDALDKAERDKVLEYRTGQSHKKAGWARVKVTEPCDIAVG